MSRIFTVTLTNDSRQLHAMLDNIAEYGRGSVRFGSHTARSMTSGYNEAIQAVSEKHCIQPDDILVLIHQDARVYFQLSKLNEYFDALPNAGVIGFVGCERMKCDSRWWLGSPLVGGLIQNDFPPEHGPNVIHRWATQPQPVDSVDGYCMVVKYWRFRQVGGFDEQFNHWHCYDADLCMKMRQAGLQNYVIPEVTKHLSGGSLADPWAQENQKWIEKWTPYLSTR